LVLRFLKKKAFSLTIGYKNKNMNEQKNIAIQLKKITKKYQLQHNKPTFFEQLLQRRNTEQFLALREVSLTIFSGQKIGILGSNGSGKTTLLKIIAGITSPTSGSVVTHGKIVSLINLEAGFHPDMTGLENVFLNGLIIGMSKNEIEKKTPSVIHFSGIKKFIDSPFYTYSQGMKLRLSFSLGIHSDPDILILDEVMAAGDAEFQSKAKKKIDQFFTQKKTILIVSHWLEFLETYCEKYLWVNKGKIQAFGGKEVLEQYRVFQNKKSNYLP